MGFPTGEWPVGSWAAALAGPSGTAKTSHSRTRVWKFPFSIAPMDYAMLGTGLCIIVGMSNAGELTGCNTEERSDNWMYDRLGQLMVYEAPQAAE